jgi:hypothetical protein
VFRPSDGSVRPRVLRLRHRLGAKFRPFLPGGVCHIPQKVSQRRVDWIALGLRAN